MGQYGLGDCGAILPMGGGAIWLSGWCVNVAKGMVGKYGLGDCGAKLPRGWWGNLA